MPKELCDGCRKAQEKAQEKLVLSVENLKLFQSKQKKPKKSERDLDVNTEISGVKRLREWEGRFKWNPFKWKKMGYDESDCESDSESDCSFSIKSATTCYSCWCPYDEGGVDSSSDAE